MAKDKPKPGPKPDTLELKGPWEERVKQALEKKRPEGGWPKAKPKRKRPRTKKSSGACS